jgi:hypothetical protein
MALPTLTKKLDLFTATTALPSKETVDKQDTKEE